MGKGGRVPMMTSRFLFYDATMQVAGEQMGVGGRLTVIKLIPKPVASLQSLRLRGAIYGYCE